MKETPPTAGVPDAELRDLLQALGHDGPKGERTAEQETAREERMAARLDVELTSLVRARRARTWAMYAGFASAAAVVLTLGLRQTQLRGGGNDISAEPIGVVSAASPLDTVQEAPSKPAASVTLPRVAEPRASAAPGVPPATAPVASTEPGSTLGEENRLFKEAAEADRSGDVSGALARLDKLLVEHPASPLAQAALVRKFRLLSKAGRSDEARREAARYLEVYPTGFGVSEAQALRGGAEPSSP